MFNLKGIIQDMTHPKVKTYILSVVASYHERSFDLRCC